MFVLSWIKACARPCLRLARNLLVQLRRMRLAPPVPRESRLIDELHRDVAAMPPLAISDSMSPADSFWLRQRQRIRERLFEQDPRTFLTWDEIRNTMFESDAAYLAVELRSLMARPNWKNRVAPALRENKVGLPDRYYRYPDSSGNLIHHAYSLSQWERCSGKTISELRQVIEFGGGYGSMCRLAFQSGFQGRYVIFDLPEFSALQRFYLRSNNYPVCSPAQPADPRVVCTSDLRELASLWQSADVDLLIATWSLSESPIELRDEFTALLPRTHNFLISYQEKFGEIDNRDYFSHWIRRHSEVHWYTWAIRHLKGNHYLIGVDRVPSRAHANC